MQFYKLNKDITDPTPASKDLSGEISARALRHCEPFLVANCAGFLVNSPADVDLIWTGSEFLARFVDMKEHILVDRVFLPDSAEHWARFVRPEMATSLPPFLESFPEHGVIQVWSGLFVKTTHGISTWIRGPVNRESGSALQVIEGIIDTDWWIGPLFTVFRFMKTDFPIRLSRRKPMLQVFPVAQALLRGSGVVADVDLIESAGPDFVSRIVDTARRRNEEPPGSYRRFRKNRIVAAETAL